MNIEYKFDSSHNGNVLRVVYEPTFHPAIDFHIKGKNLLGQKLSEISSVSFLRKHNDNKHFGSSLRTIKTIDIYYTRLVHKLRTDWVKK